MGCTSFCAAQTNTTSVYNWDWKQDGLVLAGTAAGFGASIYVVLQVDEVTPEEVNALDASKLWGIDRSAIDKSSTSLKGVSDGFLFTSASLPFLHYLSKDCRKEGFGIAGITIQSFFVADGITNLFKGSVQRLRPFTYSQNVPLEEKLTTDAKYSFVSGHTSVTALFSFLSAKFVNDLHPNSKLSKVAWVSAVTIPAITGYLRYQSGRHFPTDILGGYVVGATVGILLPHLHKKSNSDLAFNLLPISNGFVFTMRKTIK